jgi:peptide/nickel transport system substrate-binding protein
MPCGRSLACLLCLSLFCFAAGCPSPPDDATPEDKGTTTETDSGTTGTTTDAAPEESPEVLLEPFDPPPLAELDAQVEWEEQPVLDSFELLRAEKAQEPPLVSVEEALQMRNNSPEENEKILSALGQYPQSESDVNYDARIDRYTGFDLKSTNPIMISSTAEFDYSGLTGIGLIGFDRHFNLYAVKDVVARWQSSKDRLYDKFVLRDDLTWSDGTPITAHDIEFSFQTIMNPKVPVPAVRSGTDQLKWVSAYDDQTVVFFHKEALATNVGNISFPIIPRHIYKDSVNEDPTLQNSDYHIQQEAEPVVGGAYRLKSRIAGQEFVLERREDWYMRDGEQVRRQPYFKEIRFRIIEDPNTARLAVMNGDIHEYEMNPEQWVTQTSGDDFYRLNTKASGEEWALAYIAWNCRTPYFEDKRVRQAMSYALDHEEMLEQICYGIYQPCTGMFHPTAWMAPQPSPQPYRQDLDKAEELLDAAGWEDSDGDGIRDKQIDGEKVDFEFSLMLGEGTKTGERIATLLKENLDQIGVICHPQPTEFTVMQQKARDHEFQASMAGWGTGVDPDTTENIWTTKAITAGRNYCAYSNPEIDELYEKGKREFDRAERARIYARIHMILWEDQPYTWLYYRNSFFAFNKDLRGYTFSPRGPFTYGPGFDAIWMPAE